MWSGFFLGSITLLMNGVWGLGDLLYQELAVENDEIQFEQTVV